MSVFDGMADIIACELGADDGTATYSPPDRSVQVPCRPIVEDKDPESAEFKGQQRTAGRIVSVLKSEVAEPLADGVFTIKGETFTVLGEPVLQRPEFAMWRCETA